MNKIRKYYKSAILIIISGLVLYFSLAALFHRGFPDNHDRNLYLNWLFEFDQGIREGRLLPRWAPDVWAGYGAPIFNFVQPGFYYLAEFFHLLGLTLINSVKAAIVLAVVLGYAFMFLFSRIVWKNNWAAAASATIYIWSPYHLGSIYLRGAFAELLAMAWWPLILYFVHQLVSLGKSKYWYGLALATAALFLSHNALTIVFLPAALGYAVIIGYRKWRRAFFSLLALIAGAGLSAFFWLPAFIEKKYLNLELLFSGNRNYVDNFVSLKQLVVTEWKNYVFLIGLTGLAILILSLYALIERQSFEQKAAWRFFWYWLIVAGVSIFMATRSAQFIWDQVKFLHYFQFPWRFLSLVNLVVAVLAGVILLYNKIVRSWTKLIVSSLLLIVLSVVLNYAYAYPEKYLRTYRDDEYRPFREREIEIREGILSGEKTIKVYFFSEMPELFSKYTSLAGLEKMLEQILTNYAKKLNSDLDARLELPPKLEIVKGDLSVRQARLASTRYEYEITVREETVAQINTLWFPGWKAFLDNQTVVIEPRGELGVMQITLPTGEHSLRIEYKSTPIQRSAGYFSLATVSIFFGCLGYSFFRTKVKPGIRKNS